MPLFCWKATAWRGTRAAARTWGPSDLRANMVGCGETTPAFAAADDLAYMESKQQGTHKRLGTLDLVLRVHCKRGGDCLALWFQ